jgi:hypothetical protein
MAEICSMAWFNSGWVTYRPNIPVHPAGGASGPGSGVVSE